MTDYEKGCLIGWAATSIILTIVHFYQLNKEKQKYNKKVKELNETIEFQQKLLVEMQPKNKDNE